MKYQSTEELEEASFWQLSREKENEPGQDSRHGDEG